jgi:iron complex outermembrane recepter protein
MSFMMRLVIITICLTFAFQSIKAQEYSVMGRIFGAVGKTLPDASIKIANETSTFKAITDKEGIYRIYNIPKGTYKIYISHIGFETFKMTLELDSNKTVSTLLNIISYEQDEVVVTATRATEKTGLNYQTIKKEELEKLNNGKDIPYLLNSLPSVVVTSDAGTGIGYTGIRIRGTDASRINVTINGIPINDAESQNMYWVDVPDVASSVEDIQVQRGVGTSTNGTAAFGGSLNIKTNNIMQEAYGSTSFSYGSFNTIKNTVAAGSGLINNRWFVDTRLSRIKSNGYVDRGSSNLKSFYVSGGFINNNTLVKAIIFSGKEITYQSWNGIPEARLKNDAQGIKDFIGRNYLDEEDANNLLTSGRTYNYYLYPNQVDDYQQDNYQLHISQKINSHLTFNNAWHLTKGKGFYEEYKKYQSFGDYGLSDVVIAQDTITSTNLVRRKWLDNDFFGTTFSLNYQKSKLQMLLGGAWNQYDGKHFGELTWLQYAGNSFNPGYQYYKDDALKTDFTSYIKTIYDINSKLFAFVDLQYRSLSYRFIGFDETGTLLPADVSLNFFNPKAGFTFKRTTSETAWLTFAVGNREPSREDYVASSVKSRPEHETLYDIETGYEYKAGNISAQINLYWMQYDNQLVLTGQLNDVGNYTRSNIKDSYRRGVELMLGYKPFSKFDITGNITLSENKIENFSEYLFSYDDYTEEKITYKNTDIAFSPAVTGALNLSYNVLGNLTLGLLGKYVGKQYLDNTSNDKRSIDAYFVNDLFVNYSLKTKWIKQIDIGFFVYNLFDEEYESNGYTYGYTSGYKRIDENFYYPQAGTHLMGKVNVSF